ncbi:phosphoglycolate phosphatase [Solimonas marina]|uniref:phosphoglycolate phosphatase n=1 Tax=Solimonas marina TaxID=2714601 RepID=A0A969W974_9GAMM|nr:phosphoglycolate phosphatase [Solimonas marina]NKF22677.1 phosphoglycolate phosphatase [Solimonas marina]
MKLPTPKVVLFDLDGTLVDTAPDLGHAANLIRAERGLPPLPLADYRPVASAGARGLLGKALGITMDDPEFPALRAQFLDRYRDNLTRESRLFDGMEALLAAIGARGARWGIVTNKPSALTGPLLDGLQLTARSAVSISADEVARAKPAPDALLHACERLAVAGHDCWYVGDDKRDITAGRAAGMHTIAADWGYLGADEPIDEWGADRIAESPQQIADWL